MRTGGALVLVLVLLLESIVQANASLPLGGVVLVIRVPMDVAIVIIVGIFAAAAVLWGIAGILYLFNRWRRRKRLISTRKESEQSFKKNLPWKIDSTTIVTDVAADGVVLTLTFAIDMSAAEMTPGSLDALRRRHSRPRHVWRCFMTSKNAAEPSESFSPFERTRWNMVHPPNRRTEWGNHAGQY